MKMECDISSSGESDISVNQKSPTISTDAVKQRNFHCEQCSYSTDRKNNLKRHYDTMHREAKDKLECCGLYFFNKASHKEHRQKYHSEGYRCSHPPCNHVFARKALLKRHLSVHTGLKEFHCNYCNYETSHKSNLERHMRTHRISTIQPSQNIILKNNHNPSSFNHHFNYSHKHQSWHHRATVPSPAATFPQTSALKIQHSTLPPIHWRSAYDIRSIPRHCTPLDDHRILQNTLHNNVIQPYLSNMNLSFPASSPEKSSSAKSATTPKRGFRVTDILEDELKNNKETRVTESLGNSILKIFFMNKKNYVHFN